MEFLKIRLVSERRLRYKSSHVSQRFPRPDQCHAILHLLDNSQKNSQTLSTALPHSRLASKHTTNSHTVPYLTIIHHTIPYLPPQDLPEYGQNHCCLYPHRRRISDPERTEHSNVPSYKHEHHVQVWKAERGTGKSSS